MENFWNPEVWGFTNLIAVLLLSLLGANMLKKTFRFLQESLIPTSVLGGVILLIIASIYKLCTGEIMFDTAFFGGNGAALLETITYHTLALGFIASGFKSSDAKLTGKRAEEILHTGVTTVATYLLQAAVGIAITVIAALIAKDFFAAAGTLLPFGYGQGTGQAMNYGMIYENEFGFVGGKSFGLTVAAMGFLSASIGGVIYLNVLKRKGKIHAISMEEQALRSEQIQGDNEIPMQESIDKMTIQVALVLLSYLLAFFLMLILGRLLPGLKSVVYGFNFIFGVATTALIKFVMKYLKKRGVIEKTYVNNFLMTRVSNFFFDVMVTAGIAVIRLNVLGRYWFILIVLGVVGLVVTYIYNRIIAHNLFPDYEIEQFLAMYGMLTGTASTGIILLREVDPGFETPVADNLVLQNFPAILLGFPIMLLATTSPKHPILVMLISLAGFLVLNLFLFRKRVFKKK